MALRYPKNNLVLNKCPEERINLCHQVEVFVKHLKQADLIVGALREDEGSKGVILTVKQAEEQLLQTGPF